MNQDSAVAPRNVRTLDDDVIVGQAADGVDADAERIAAVSILQPKICIGEDGAALIEGQKKRIAAGQRVLVILDGQSM